MNEDYKSTPREYSTVHKICVDNKDKLIDLRPYMIEELYTVGLKDKLPKVLDIFRKMHLRQLPVINVKTGKAEGIITR